MLIGSKSLNCIKSGFLRVSYICYIFVSEQESGHELLLWEKFYIHQKKKPVLEFSVEQKTKNTLYDNGEEMAYIIWSW